MKYFMNAMLILLDLYLLFIQQDKLFCYSVSLWHFNATLMVFSQLLERILTFVFQPQIYSAVSGDHHS